MPVSPEADLIPANVLNVALQTSLTPTALARALLMGTFDMKTLLSSNLKGGASRRPDCATDIRLQKLDSSKLEAIYGQCYFRCMPIICVLIRLNCHTLTSLHEFLPAGSIFIYGLSAPLLQSLLYKLALDIRHFVIKMFELQTCIAAVVGMHVGHRTT